MDKIQIWYKVAQQLSRTAIPLCLWLLYIFMHPNFKISIIFLISCISGWKFFFASKFKHDFSGTCKFGTRCCSYPVLLKQLFKNRCLLKNLTKSKLLFCWNWWTSLLYGMNLTDIYTQSISLQKQTFHIYSDIFRILNFKCSGWNIFDYME